MPYLNLASIRLCTEAEGPGKRAAIWVQGCPRKCKGCCNPEMQEFRKNMIVNADDIITLLSNAVNENSIEGVTFIGGEPILQAEGLAHIAEWCRNNSLSVMLFTGYLYDELKGSKDVNIARLLKNTDLLVDGPYLEECFDTKRCWIGSENQKIYHLSDRYPKGIEYSSQSRPMEIMISDSSILINGWPYT